MLVRQYGVLGSGQDAPAAAGYEAAKVGDHNHSTRKKETVHTLEEREQQPVMG